MLYSLARPLLFSMAPERAHDLTLSLLKSAHKMGFIRQKIDAKPVTCMGIEFPNPVGLAAGLDKNGAYIDALAALGFDLSKSGRSRLARKQVIRSRACFVFLKPKPLSIAWVSIMTVSISSSKM